ncbi:MAG: leucyl/phenylalanyl-tRNA--protein transferase [Saprospiraceae bacterium]
MAPVFIPNTGVPIDFSQCSTEEYGPEGIVAIGANFHPQTLLNAYSSGLFPWYIYDGFPHWFSPDPRMVLFPQHLKLSKSMRNVFNQKKFNYTCDACFDRVIEACANTQRKNDVTTWIDQDFIEAYTQLHQFGFAHSFEAWQGEVLVGGLYGVSIGEVFFGESMFSTMANASKAAFIKAVRFLSLHQFKMIDCQVYSDHLSSLGAIPISRGDFQSMLAQGMKPSPLTGIHWKDLFADLK